MSNTIPYEGSASFPVPTGQDSTGNPAPLKAQGAIIDQPSVALLAKASNGVWVCPVLGGVAQGGGTTVNVTLNAQDANGDPLPALVQQFAIEGAPSAPLAVLQVDPGAVTINPPGTSMPGGQAASISLP
jgi:hypothetical protein